MVTNLIIEAEDALFQGPLLGTDWAGSQGTGYLDYQNATGDFIEWTVNVPTAGLYNLSWRYALGNNSNRPLALAINGTTQVASLSFPGTGAWTTWDFVNEQVQLNAGSNTIRLTAIGSSGANIDYLQVTDAVVPRNVTISNATATEGVDNFLVFDVSLNTPSEEIVTLNLAATDTTARGGLLADFNLDPAGNPVDYAKQEFEVSTDGGSTWQAATNGTQASFAVGQTALKVRLAVNDDTANEGNVAETMSLGVSSVVAGTVNDISDTGVGAIIDNDRGSINDIYQAEDALFQGPELSTQFSGSQGGYLDYQNPSGDFIEWTVTVPTAGFYNLSWRYALGNNSNRPLALAINGTTQVASLSFLGTGAWTTWDFVNQQVQLNAGINRVRLTATGSSGANIDYLQVTSASRNVTISNATATEGVDNFLVFDLSLSTPSLEIITVNLAATDTTARGGLISDFDEDLAGNPIDYAKQEFEVSTDGGSTWQAATNGTQVSFAAGQTALKVRLAINNDTANEGNVSETMSLGVAGVLSGTVNDISDTGIGAIIDNDRGNINDIYQAENAFFQGPELSTQFSGSQGSYLDYQNPSEDFIEWTVTVPRAGFYNLSWRYALGSNASRPLALAINGTTKIASLDFPVTESFTDWNFVNQPAQLNAGINTVRLTAIGSSGANIDYLQVSSLSREVTISDATVTEGIDDFLGLGFNNFLVFNVSLTAPSEEVITLNLAATDGRARGGLISEFGTSPANNPIDYAKQEFEFSSDSGNTWQAATNGTQITFAPGQTSIWVRIAINDDTVREGLLSETMTLSVANVVTGAQALNSSDDTGIGSIYDNDSAGTGTPPLSLLPATDVRIEGDLILNFDGTDGGLTDRNGDRVGFTMVDPTSNPGNPNPTGGVVGYWPNRLDVNPNTGILRITTTAGIQAVNNNSLDNALGVGLNLPSRSVKLQTTLVNLPAASGDYAQAGLWFGQAVGGGLGSSEDNYIKLVIISPSPGDYQIQALMEQNGVIVQQQYVDIPDNPSSLTLNLALDPVLKRVTATYNLPSAQEQTVISFGETVSIPDAWFSFDQAGLDPTIGTRSFGGIFATHRFANTSKVFSFDNFSVMEDPRPVVTDFAFDRWSIPINFATSMEYGPDGRLYVATLLGTIHALTIDPTTRTFTDEIINTIPQQEGGGRLTLGLAIDPASTANNVILWVSHSDGDVFTDGDFNSGKVSRLSGPGFTQKDDIITGLPRAIANHASNDIDFGPDGRLYIWQGGNTGTGSANTEPTEFGDRAEQVLSAALLVADVKAPGFNGNAASLDGEFIDEFYTRTGSDVLVYASGLRNTYDGVFHSNGKIYAPDNGLGVVGTVPPVPRLGSPTDRNITTLFGDPVLDNPGTQPDPLNLIVEGGYYGHPNPYRDEVIFKDGSLQGFNSTNTPPGHPQYRPPLLELGFNRSPDGIIEYTADNFFNQLNGDLLINNFSIGDNITRVRLTPDGLSVVGTSTLAEGFVDPLPITMGPNGTLVVGEFNGDKITILESLGTWRTDLPQSPIAILDAGSAALGDKLYLVGGKTASAAVNTVYIYDPGDPFSSEDDVWTNGPNLPGTGVENPSVVAFNNQLYAFGGSTAPFSGAQTTATVLNPTVANPAWNSLAPMLTARGGATAQVLDDKIYVIGGLGADGASLNTVEVYDPLTNTWSTASSMQTRRDRLGSAVIDDKLYVFGGRTRNADGSIVNGNLTSLEIYDPLTGQWSSGASMLTGRRAMSVGTLNNRIQVIGGEGNTVFNQNEEYNPLTNTWRSLPQIPTSRHGAAFGTIDDVIYVTGGSVLAGSSFSDLTEAFAF